MQQARKSRGTAIAAIALVLAGCSGGGQESRGHGRDALNCMERAIYFESNRSSRAGMIAVGSVVMNRVESDKFPDTVCGVVGQKGQFAPGIMTRPMKPMPDVREAAIAVLRGERQPAVADAMFFHTSGYRFSYDNMHYVLVAGGNAFYEKRPSHLVTRRIPPSPIDR